LQFGFPTSTFPSGQWTGFKAVLSGDVANNYAGDTTIMDCVVVLQKNGVVAIPSANVTIGAATPYANPQLRLGADNQINPAAVIHMYADAAGAYWNSFEMMSHSQTIGGLRSNNGVNVISNSFCEAAPDGTVGTLTVNSAAPDNYYYGIIRDISGLAPNTSKFALVKDGAGTLLLEAGGNGWFTYTGTTTINNGALIVTSADATGGVSTTNTLTGDFSGAGMLIVGDGVNHPALNLTNVDMTGTVQVAELATLNAASIKADTLIIGGAPIVTVPHAAAAVPEPSALLLLAIACASIAWFRLKK
jgi:autotransporter-associated beta strand protein